MGREFRCFGPPGTGKTTYVASQVRGAVEKYGSDAVIVASFTRAAAAEIAGRDLPVDPDRVGTLHALCYRALGRPAIAETKLKEFNELHPAFALSGEGADLDEPASERAYETSGDELMSRYQVLRARMVPREMWPADVTGFASRWESWRDDRGYVDFTGMIERAIEEMDSAPGGPRVGFFDEAQDFTRLELTLIRKWARAMEYVIIAGDDDQAIYSWLGASSDAFLDPPVPESQKRILRQSYRVPAAIQRAASTWIAGVSRREPKDYRPREEEGEIRESEASWRYVEPLLDDVQQTMDRGKTAMVLASCSYMLVPLLAVLREQGIPFHNPYRRRRGDWNPLSGGRGTSATERLLAFMRPSEEMYGEGARDWTCDDVRNWGEVLKAEGVWKHGRKVQIENMKGLGPAGLMNVADHLANDEAVMAIVGLDLDWYESHLLPARRKAFDFPLTVYRKRGARALREKPRLTVGTIHSVKGGESDVVYLVPDLSLSGMREWSTPGESRDGIIRQFYVGLTRARETVVLCQPATPFNVGRLVA